MDYVNLEDWIIFFFLLVAIIHFFVRPARKIPEPDKNQISIQRAEEQADLLLERFLTPDELEKLKRLGYIDVASPNFPDRFYRIYDHERMAKVYEAEKLIAYCCVQTSNYLPNGDRILMHKFSIEGDEEQYLKVANWREASSATFMPASRLSRSRQ